MIGILSDWSVAKMAENKMEQVAAMFGKKLGEEFEVNGKYKEQITCQLTEQGLLYLDRNFGGWEDAADYMLTDLLTGEAVIVDD